MAAVVPTDVVPALLAFLLLLLGEGSWVAPAYSSSSSDAVALLSFKAAVKEDPGGFLSSWGRGEYAQYPCSWHGVACSDPNGSVVSLALPNAGLTGPLRPLLSALSGLQKLLHLDLSGNSLFGNFSDYPPPSLPSLLRSLNLSRNRISGALPLGVFSNLEDLNLSANALSGGIPLQLFPAAAGVNLRALDLSQNNLTGTIPSTIVACAHLSLLNLASNRLSGVLPEDFVSSLVSLESLYLGNNSLSGSLLGLPGGNSSSVLKILDLSSNRISGTIPPQICVSLPLLEWLLLQNNVLSGGLPVALANCTELRALGLSFNSLAGSLPPEWSELSKLESLSAWNSGLTGEIPPQYGKLGQLRNLILNDNELSGAIPAELGNCTRMEWLSLSGNRLMGEIPEVGDAVTVLQLGGNLLSGELPPGLGNCTHLLWLDASGNELTGAISPHLFNGSRHALNKTTLGGDAFAFARNMADGVCHGIGSLLDFSGMTIAALWSVPSLRPCVLTARLYLGTTLSSNTDFSSIQYLDLSRNNLHGSIPMELGNAQALQILDLSHNSLYGTIPASFAALRNLGVLDLSNNELEGSIWPLANCTFLVQINLSDNFFSGVIPQTGQLATASASAYANNPALCGEPLPACGAAAATSRNSGNSLPQSRRFGALSRATIIILSVLVSLALLCLMAIALALLAGMRKRKRQKTLLGSIRSSFDGSHSSWNLSAEKEPLSINVATFERPLVRKLTFSHLVEATDGFSRGSLIGRGGFGEVYRARLKDDGAVVAIKKLVQCACQGDREFMAEMETLGKIKHRNLVPLLGYCKVGEERLLVYEFMEGGSLDEVLHTGSREHLTWERRKRIAKGAARGLAFLHHNCIPHIIHRDMKSSNVLLDKDMEARVSDFGMARLINALDTHLSVSTLAGTPGYVPPEYYQSFRCTAKGDVYSFGVVLLELLTGRRPTDKEGAPEFDDNCNLVGWVKLHITQKREMDVLDPVLLREKGGDDEGGGSTPAAEQEMLHYLRIACSCLEDLPFKRPSILQVVAMFKDLDNFDMPAGQATSCSSSSSSSLSSQPNLAQRVLNHFSFSSSENPKGDIEDLLSNNRGGAT